MRKFVALLVVFITLASSLVPVSATVVANEPATSPQQEGTFVPMAPEQYDALVQLLEYGSEEEKQFAQEYILNALNNGASTYGWNPTTTVPQPDGTNLISGFVVFTYSTIGMAVNTVVPAKMRGSPQYGYTWYEINSSAAYSAPGSGMYEYITGAIIVTQHSTTLFTIDISGYFQISTENAHQLSIDIELFDYNYTLGATSYCREYVYAGYYAYTPVSGT